MLRLGLVVFLAQGLFATAQASCEPGKTAKVIAPIKIPKATVAKGSQVHVVGVGADWISFYLPKDKKSDHVRRLGHLSSAGAPRLSCQKD